MNIQILIDNTKSWIVPYVKEFIQEPRHKERKISLVHQASDVVRGDMLFLIACEKKFYRLDLNKFNLVVHESDLPKGRGMSPFTWQILEGKSSIIVTLLEATTEIDSGKVYKKIEVKLRGTELVDEWRSLQAQATIDLIEEFMNNYSKMEAAEQSGNPTYYRRRTMDDSELDVNKSIRSQFNLLRIVDNERYPAWFELNGERFILKISRVKP